MASEMVGLGRPTYMGDAIPVAWAAKPEPTEADLAWRVSDGSWMGVG